MTWGQAAPAQKTEAELDAEARQASDLHTQGKTLATLPLYEDLHTRRPQNVIYTERLAMAYLAKSGAAETEEDRVAANNQARRLLKEAQAQGDNSDLLQILLEKLGAAEPATRQKTPSDLTSSLVNALDPRAAGKPFARAEILFNKGDVKGALDLYAQSWKENPGFYSAPLFAGDMEYRLNHYDEAGVWFARAIAISPDIETAHRYWGDCLEKAGKPQEARRRYIDAFIASPYEKAPRLTMRAWADANHARYIPPQVSLPARPAASKDGHINITVPAADGKDDPMTAVWLAYSIGGAAWQAATFKKTYPNEKAYRHSLAEEVDSLHVMLEVARRELTEGKKLPPMMQTLMALDKDGMLECWIVLDNPDNGVAQDYAAYRAKHRDLLRAYIEKYDLHPA